MKHVIQNDINTAAFRKGYMNGFAASIKNVQLILKKEKVTGDIHSSSI